MKYFITILVTIIAVTSVVSSEIESNSSRFLMDELEPYQKYDFYVYSFSWSDSFCRTIAGTPASIQDCYNRISKLHYKRVFRIHGLWASMKDGSNLNSCNTGKYITIPDSDEEPYVTMSEIWPSLNKNGEKDFWAHEYNKHGHCYTLRNNFASFTPFFKKSVELYNQFDMLHLMDKAFHARAGDRIAISYQNLEDKFSSILGGVFFEFECRFENGEQLFYELRIYLNLNFSSLNGFKYNKGCKKDKDLVFYFENDN